MLTKGELCSCKVKKVILHKHSTLQLHETALPNKKHMHGVCKFNRSGPVYQVLSVKDNFVCKDEVRNRYTSICSVIQLLAVPSCLCQGGRPAVLKALYCTPQSSVTESLQGMGDSDKAISST